MNAGLMRGMLMHPAAAAAAGPVIVWLYSHHRRVQQALNPSLFIFTSFTGPFARTVLSAFCFGCFVYIKGCSPGGEETHALPA